MGISILPEALAGKPCSIVTEAEFRIRLLFVEELSKLIGKTATTIRTCASNDKYRHLIPQPFKLPHSRRLCWYEHDVLAWIESQRPSMPPPKKRPRGRPTKVEQFVREQWEAGSRLALAAGR